MEDDTRDQIMRLLEQTELDLPITTIADEIGITRQTAAKYLSALNAEGRITCTRKVGHARFFDVNKEEYVGR